MTPLSQSKVVFNLTLIYYITWIFTRILLIKLIITLEHFWSVTKVILKYTDWWDETKDTLTSHPNVWLLYKDIYDVWSTHPERKLCHPHKNKCVWICVSDPNPKRPLPPLRMLISCSLWAFLSWNAFNCDSVCGPSLFIDFLLLKDEPKGSWRASG